MVGFVSSLVMSAGGDRQAGKSRSSSPSSSLSRRYLNVTGFPFPLGPALSRSTLRREIIPGQMWSFEQEQGLAGSDVSTNVRMTVVKMRNGKLWVHAPIAPTEECLSLLEELNCPVESIVNSTYAYEHKIFIGPFSRRFPDAKLFSVRGWSFPLPLPDAFLGLNVHAYLDEEDKIQWSDEISFKLLPSSYIGVAPYTEAAFLHHESRTLITTDVVICVPESPPEVIPEAKLQNLGKPDSWLASFRPGRFSSSPDEVSRSTLGWMRMTSLALFLGPDSLVDPRGAFESVAGRLTVSPVLRVLVFGKIRSAIRRWAEEIMEWDFDRIVPAHFAAPVEANADDFREALACIIEKEDDGIKEDDLRVLRSINNFLRVIGVVNEEEK